jgi:hypothetical protein
VWQGTERFLDGLSASPQSVSTEESSVRVGKDLGEVVEIWCVGDTLESALGRGVPGVDLFGIPVMSPQRKDSASFLCLDEVLDLVCESSEPRISQVFQCVPTHQIDAEDAEAPVLLEFFISKRESGDLLVVIHESSFRVLNKRTRVQNPTSDCGRTRVLMFLSLHGETSGRVKRVERL